MSPVRRTHEGVELSSGFLKTLSLLLGVIVASMVVISKIAKGAEQLDAAVTNEQFRGHVVSESSRMNLFDSNVSELRDAIAQVQRNQQRDAEDQKKIQCWIAKYPIGLCDGVQRSEQGVRQAGTPR